MALHGLLLIRLGPLKRDEELDDVLDEYKEQGSIVAEITRVCGVSSERSTDRGRDRGLEMVPEKVVKKAGCYTKTSFDIVEQNERTYDFLTHDEEEPAMRFRLKYRTLEALIDLGVVKPQIIEHPGETIVMEDDEALAEENARLKKELEEFKERVKTEEAEEHKEVRQKKRKRLETATVADLGVTDERPANRRLPTGSDEVISLED